MRGKISMDLSFCQSETGFSLDELIVKLADVYERKAFPELDLIVATGEWLRDKHFGAETEVIEVTDEELKA